MINDLKVYFVEIKEHATKNLQGRSEKKRDEARGQLEAIDYFEAICAHHKSDVLYQKIDEETAEVFLNKLRYAINEREERIWIASIQASKDIKESIKGFLKV